jgi:hypothetical protein
MWPERRAGIKGNGMVNEVLRNACGRGIIEQSLTEFLALSAL